MTGVLVQVTQAYSATTTITGTLPVGDAGDTLLVYFSGQSSPGTTPAGWTRQFSDNMTVAAAAGYRKVSDGTETTFSFSVSAGDNRLLMVRAGGNGFDVNGRVSNDNNNTTVDLPSITSTNPAGDTLIAMYSHHNATSWSSIASGWTAILNSRDFDSHNPLAGIAKKVQTVSGASGTANFVANDTYRRGGWVVGIKNVGRLITPRRQTISTGYFRIGE